MNDTQHSDKIIEPAIIYEEPDFVVVNKPSGVIVHPARVRGEINKRPSDFLTAWLLRRYPEMSVVGDDPEERPGIVHRLDKDTSGALIACRTQAAFVFFKKLFQDHQIKKEYLALVANRPPENTGSINKPIGVKDGTIKRTVHGGKMIKEALTEYRIDPTFRSDGTNVFRLIVFPATGRTHQIRVHLAAIGCPILGDAIYGKKNKSTGRLMLHAFSLTFTSPSGKAMRIECPAPPEFMGGAH